MAKPKIRFKGYTDDWEQRKLGEIAIEILAGGDIDKEKVVDDGTYPIYANALTNDGIVGYYNDYYRVKAPAVTVTGRGEVGHAQARMTDFTPVVRLLAIRSNHDCYFLENAINNQNVVVESTGVPQLTVPQLSSYDICFPKDIREEEKIGAYYKKLDNLITLHQRKCEETKKLKKYMLQKMFPQNGQTVPEIRFAGFTDAWEQRKFSDIATRESSVCTSASDIPSVEYEDVVAEEGRLNKDIRSKEVAKAGITFDGSQVLYGKLRPYLHNWLNPDFKGIAVGDWWVLKPVNMDKNFLYRLIQTQQFDNVANQSSGSKMPRADWNLISSSEFMLPPSKEEQSKIGGYFDELDHLITLHQCKCRVLPKLLYNDWEQRKLGDICSRVQGNDGRMELPTLTISAGNGWMNQEDRFSGNIAGKEQKNYTLLKRGELSYNHGNSKLAKYGTVFSLQTYEEALVPRVYHSFKVEKGNANFVEYYFATKLPDRELGKLISSGARMDGLLNIGYDDFMGISLLLPKTQEQDCIAGYFRKIDMFITLHHRKYIYILKSP